MSCPALIDFEASCLPEYGRSYPIEVAIARMDGDSRAWLIKPMPQWEFWDWSEEAEALHGISREMLDKEGQDPALVLAEMAEYVSDCQVYADADLDQYWLEVLCQAMRTRLPFPVRYLGELILKRGYTRPQVLAALDLARQRLPQAHLAREDAKRLALTLKLLFDEPPQGLSA